MIKIAPAACDKNSTFISSIQSSQSPGCQRHGFCQFLTIHVNLSHQHFLCQAISLGGFESPSDNAVPVHCILALRDETKSYL